VCVENDSGWFGFTFKQQLTTANPFSSIAPSVNASQIVFHEQIEKFQSSFFQSVTTAVSLALDAVECVTLMNIWIIFNALVASMSILFLLFLSLCLFMQYCFINDKTFTV